MRNFLSVGNSPITIGLTLHQLTLISGGNGAGKSTIMDAICFALYGKAYRNINKPQLVNSINKKQCEVIVEFDIGKKEYKVRRGISPNVFEIFENGILINQDPNIRDYQKVLEQQILKMNYRAFTQIVIMGSGSYVPFMKLAASQRREFIEDLLDIRVFSVMNSLLKVKIKTAKEQQKDCENEIALCREKIALQEAFIKKQVSEKDSIISSIEEEIEQITRDITKCNIVIAKTQEEIDELTLRLDKFDDVSVELADARVSHKTISRKISELREQSEFYDINDECPTCKQDIEDGHKNAIIQVNSSSIAKWQDELLELTAQISKLTAQLTEVDRINGLLRPLNEAISVQNRNISVSNSLTKSKNAQISTMQSNSSSLDEEKAKLRIFAKQLLAADKRKKEIMEQQQYYSASSALLQDSGIKSKIIRQYIPTINKIVNKYLDSLDFFVSFHLNENFEEVVKSRHRDTFTYESFSEGQKLRIDLSLTFAWRDIARMKNSVNTNLVFLDEIFDASLEASAVELAMGLLSNMKDSNIFVISHRDGIADKFNHLISVSLKNNFTFIQQ